MRLEPRKRLPMSGVYDTNDKRGARSVLVIVVGNRCQKLDDVVGFSYPANILRKGMNPCLLPLAMS